MAIGTQPVFVFGPKLRRDFRSPDECLDGWQAAQGIFGKGAEFVAIDGMRRKIKCADRPQEHEVFVDGVLDGSDRSVGPPLKIGLIALGLGLPNYKKEQQRNAGAGDQNESERDAAM